jgi:acetyl-CoA acyltransferase
MRDAVIVAALRTPIGRRGGALAGVHPADLSAVVLTALIERTGLDPALVDDVVWGCVSQVGEQSFGVGRNAVLSAGWPVTVPATTVERQCGSSQQAVHAAAAGVIAGLYDIAVAGGVESMSRVPMGSAITASPFGQRYAARFGPDVPDQGVCAEMIAAQHKLTRRQLDEFSLASHEKAAAAIDAGRFADQIVPVPTPDGLLSQDEGVRRGSTLDKLAGLRPAFRPDGLITAASSSQISDGAAALLVTTSARAAELGLRPLARVHTAVLAAVEPVPMLHGPMPATRKALERAGLDVRDIGAFEINEAFAPIPLAWLRELEADPGRLNPNGGAIALGHPLGGSGARLMTTLVHHMRQTGVRYGLQAMCEGGGQANATILELL